MSLDLFRVIGNIDLQNNELTSNANIIQGSGLPGGDGAVQDSAPIGSIFLRTDTAADNLQFYYKWTTTNNSSADWKIAADKDYVDAVAQGLSWREPVRVMDSTTYADSSAFPTSGTIDSVVLSVGDRVLFTDVTDGTEENVFVWDGAAWSEDTNAETSGDALFIQEGTKAGTQWTYDGATWVQFGSATDASELEYLRDYTGKTGPGAENPSYSSTDVIVQGSNLEVAIGALDDAMGTGEITNDGGNYSLSSDLTWGAAGTLEVTDALNDLNNSIGDRSYTGDNVVTDGETVASSIDALDVAVGSIINQTNISTGTAVDASATVTVDTLSLADATESKWIIQVRENGTPANRRALEVHAINDGATLVDHTEYAVLKLGSNIAGFDVNVAISGTDMVLTMKATNPIDYVVKRVAYTAFA